MGVAPLWDGAARGSSPLAGAPGAPRPSPPGFPCAGLGSARAAAEERAAAGRRCPAEPGDEPPAAAPL